jgi:hypothetical protein
MNDNNDEMIKLTPKGVFVVALFDLLPNDFNGRVDAAGKIHDKVFDFLQKTNSGIIADGEKLVFAQLEKTEL